MSTRPSSRRQAGTLLALVLLILRLAIPAHSMSASNVALEGGLAEWLANMPICHADAGQAPVTPEPSDKPAAPMQDCSLCPVCQLAAAPALLPAATWHPTPLPVAAAQVALLPPFTGPPQPQRYAAPPRGPPASAV